MHSTLLDRLQAWPARLTWLLLPLLAGPALAAGLDGTSRPVQVVASAGAWAIWAAILLATLIPTMVTLTALRVVAPATPVAVAAAAILDIPGSGATGWHVTGLSWAVITAGAAFLPSTTATFINGSSYGPELRSPLRIPGPLLFGPVELAWLATVAGTVTGPLLLAAGQWVAGALAVAAGIPAVWWGWRALHMLARRWTVLVPGGLVVHDPLALADPVLLRRSTIVDLGPAPAGTDALDLTCGALGLAVEITLRNPIPLVTVTNPRHGTTETVTTAALLLTPARPGAFLAAARRSGLGRAERP